MIRNPHNFLDTHLDTLRSQGRYTFTLTELRQQYNSSKDALTKALQRLKQKQEAVALRKEFYVILPPEYRNQGIPPPHLFIPDLMKFLNRKYYLGLTTAAALHTNADPAGDIFIITTKPVLNPIRNINFCYKHNWDEEEIIDNVSSPELTALDVVRYCDHLGGLTEATKALDYLSEFMDKQKLVTVAKNYGQIATIQRLGFILHEILCNGSLPMLLFDYLKTIKHHTILLHPQKQKPATMVTGNKWRVVPNIEINIFNGTHIFS